MKYDNLIRNVSKGASIVLPVRRYRVCNAARSKFKRMQKSSELKSPQTPGIKSYKITNLIADTKQRKSYKKLSNVQKYRRVNEICDIVLRHSMDNNSTSDCMPDPIDIRHNEELASNVMIFFMDLRYELEKHLCLNFDILDIHNIHNTTEEVDQTMEECTDEHVMNLVNDFLEEVVNENDSNRIDNLQRFSDKMFTSIPKYAYN